MFILGFWPKLFSTQYSHLIYCIQVLSYSNQNFYSFNILKIKYGKINNYFM